MITPLAHAELALGQATGEHPVVEGHRGFVDRRDLGRILERSRRIADRAAREQEHRPVPECVLVSLDKGPGRLQPVAGVDTGSEHDGVVVGDARDGVGLDDVDLEIGRAQDLCDRLGDLGRRSVLRCGSDEDLHAGLPFCARTTRCGHDRPSRVPGTPTSAGQPLVGGLQAPSSPHPARDPGSARVPGDGAQRPGRKGPSDTRHDRRQGRRCTQG